MFLYPINTIFCDSKNRLWIGAWDNVLHLYNMKNNSMESVFLDTLKKIDYSGNEVTCINEDKNGWLWVGTRKSGLYLDVERMFKEKVTIYPHPSDILEYSRDTAMFFYFKIVLRSWYENIREYTTATFSSSEYIQMQVDTIFIKYIIPHYLSNDYQDHNSNNTGTNGRTALVTLMNDVLEAVEDRHHHHRLQKRKARA